MPVSLLNAAGRRMLPSTELPPTLAYEQDDAVIVQDDDLREGFRNAFRLLARENSHRRGLDPAGITGPRQLTMAIRPRESAVFRGATVRYQFSEVVGTPKNLPCRKIACGRMNFACASSAARDLSGIRNHQGPRDGPSARQRSWGRGRFPTATMCPGPITLMTEADCRPDANRPLEVLGESQQRAGVVDNAHAANQSVDRDCDGLELGIVNFSKMQVKKHE